METQKILQIQDITTDQLKETLSGAIKCEISSLRDEISQQKITENLLSPKDVCDLLGISKVSLWSWTKSGKLTSYGIGAKRYYKESEILTNSLKRQK